MPCARRLVVALLVASPASLSAAQLPLRFGDTISARLTAADSTFGDGSHYRTYVFTGAVGDTVTADLTSDDFDAYLVLTDAVGNRLTADDDDGGACNARLTYVLPAEADYRVYATSSKPAEVGGFRLSLIRGRSPAPADSTCTGFSGRVVGRLSVGQSVADSLTARDAMLTDSTYVRAYVLVAAPSETFTVDLESEDFDAYLLLERGAKRLLENDDGGGNCHARIVYAPADDRPLRLVVNTASMPPRQTGRYTLRVSRGALAPDPRGNCASRR